MLLPRLDDRPPHNGNGPLWNVSEDRFELGWAICRSHQGPLPTLDDCEGADEAVAAFLLAQLRSEGFQFFDCFMHSKIDLDEMLVECGESDVCYRGQVGGFQSPLDRTLEIPLVDSGMLSESTLRGLSTLLRSDHPLWRVALLESKGKEIVVYPDCIRSRDCLFAPNDCGELIRSWKELLLLNEATKNQQCQEMARVIPSLKHRWPQPEHPEVLGVFQHDNQLYVWTAIGHGDGSYTTLNDPPVAGIGSVWIDRELNKSRGQGQMSNCCLLECSRYSSDVTMLKLRNNRSGRTIEISLKQLM